MSRETYVLRDGQLLTKREAYTHETTQSFQVIGDIQEFRSPIDGSMISSRSHLREHEQKHGVRQVGNDWSGSTKPTWWDDRNRDAR